jgi:hypothetical protein
VSVEKSSRDWFSSLLLVLLLLLLEVVVLLAVLVRRGASLTVCPGEGRVLMLPVR